MVDKVSTEGPCIASFSFPCNFFLLILVLSLQKGLWKLTKQATVFCFQPSLLTYPNLLGEMFFANHKLKKRNYQEIYHNPNLRNFSNKRDSFSRSIHFLLSMTFSVDEGLSYANTKNLG
jgi:hypothetical protein